MPHLRYYVADKTLVIKGNFDGLSTGIDGGRHQVEAVLNREVSGDFNDGDPVRYMEKVAARLGIDRPYFSFLTAVHMDNLCVVRDHQVTAFVTAGISNPCHEPTEPGTINVIIVVHGSMSEGALAGAIITATEAKSKALFDMGLDFTGTTTDAVAILKEERKTKVCEPPYFEYSGTATDIGQSIYRSVKKGVTESIKRDHLLVDDVHTCRLFVYAVIDGSPRWFDYPREKIGKGKCDYYPCHFQGQDCTHCYCPLYPCEDPGLGEWIKSGHGYPVWTCKDCILLHNKKGMNYLAKHPDATTDELKSALKDGQ